MENWRDVKGYEGLYQVSDMGSVRRDGKVLKGGITRGYPSVSLCKNGVQKSRTVHLLMAEAFLGHIRNGFKIVVDHIDHNPLNNTLSNLRLISNRENTSRHRNVTSKYVGVCWDKSREKWKAAIKVNGKVIGLGRYADESKAAQAYQNALNELI